MSSQHHYHHINGRTSFPPQIVRDQRQPLTIDDERLPNKEVRIELSTLAPPNSKSFRQRLNGTGDYSSEDAEPGLLAIQAQITIDASERIVPADRTCRNVRGTLQRYRFECFISFDDSHENWGEKGRLIGGNSSIKSLELQFRGDFVGRISEDSILRLRQLYQGIESSSSAIDIHLCNPTKFLTDDQLFPTLKLSGEGVFTNLKRLTLSCLYPSHLVSESQSIYIASHLENLSLDEIHMSGTSFGTAFIESDSSTESDSLVLAAGGNNDVGAPNRSVISIDGVRHVVHYLRFQKVLFACRNVKQMCWTCDFGDEAFDVMAQFLQQPSIKLEHLCLRTRRPSTFDTRSLQILAKGLKNNATVTTLTICHGDLIFLLDVLCDTNSIKSIINSNHTLHLTDRDGSTAFLPRRLSVLLAFNLIEDKNKVVRKKIFRYYFSEDFDVSELRGLPTSVFPRLISAMHGEASELNAIYKFVQGIPKILCYKCGA